MRAQPINKNYKDVKVWDTYNYLTVIWVEYPTITCRCECWNVFNVSVYNLIRQNQKSCKDCQFVIYENIKHWLMRRHMSKEDKSFCDKYKSMYHRCNNENDIWYKNYWWRWIRCEWNNMLEFKRDMYDSYKEHIKIHWVRNTTLDRIDVNKNYCKENCRWATYKEQWINRRNNTFIEIDWIKYSYFDIAKEIWCSYLVACQRANKYKDWKITKEELFHKWTMKWYHRPERFIIKWVEYSRKSLAEKLWCSRVLAGKRLTAYRAGKISEDEVVVPILSKAWKYNTK